MITIAKKRATLSSRALAACSILLVPACGSSTPSNDTGAGGAAGSESSTGMGGGGTFGSGGTGIIGSGGSIRSDGGPLPDGSNDSPDGCGQSAIQATTKIVNILLVIDRSDSMNSMPAGFSTDKWSAMKTALSGALDVVKGGVSFGLELFPNNLVTPIPSPCSSQCWDMPPGEGGILVPVGPGTTTVAPITAKLSLMPAGGTPTAAALKIASDYFTMGSGKSLPGDKYVLLATDGGPNGNTIACGASTCTTNMDRNQFTINFCDEQAVPGASKSCLDEKATVDQLSAMAAAGIKTFVVGIPGTDPYISTLDAMAVAGGAPASMTSPKYFAVSAAGGVAGLQQAFESITKQLIKSCTLQLQSNPPDVSLLNVYIDGTVLPQQGPDGWQVDSSTTPPTIVLKGATCASIEANGANMINIQYGCPTVIVPR
jgi:hypothetical protein